MLKSRGTDFKMESKLYDTVEFSSTSLQVEIKMKSLIVVTEKNSYKSAKVVKSSKIKVPKYEHYLNASDF